MGPNEENLKCIYPLKSESKYSAMELNISLRSNGPILGLFFFFRLLSVSPTASRWSLNSS